MAESVRLKNGLTPNQTKIVKLTAEQIINDGRTNLTEVGMKVYTNQKPNSARVSASQELQKPAVKDALEEALVKNGLNFNTVLGNIKRIASVEPEKLSGETILKANIEAMKILGGYPDKKTAHVRLDIKGKIGKMDYNQAKKEYESMDNTIKDLITEADS